MREIKFRAWNGKEMFNVDVLAISPCTWDCPDYQKRGVSLAYQPHIKVMQYTGLKDREGAEIYEGDILKDHSGVGEVEWVQEHCAFRIFVKDPDFGNMYMVLESDGQMKYTEIIGNIYEHRHLLEVGYE